MKLTRIITFIITALVLSIAPLFNANAALRDVDKGTFNEFKFHIQDQLIELKTKYEATGKADSVTIDRIKKLIELSLDYLPDESLINKRLSSSALASLERLKSSPKNEIDFDSAVTKSIEFVDDARIEKMKGNIRTDENSGNAPFRVTFTGEVRDPYGEILPNSSYEWSIVRNGQRQIIARKRSFNYTFNQEGQFKVFLDVKSTHRNSKGNIDVIPLSLSKTITVKQEGVNFFLKVNNERLGSRDSMKFTIEEARRGLIFDATSSTGRDASRIVKTEWDFGNLIERENSGPPKIERVVYNKEGKFSVVAKLKTSKGVTIRREFTLLINDPIASIVGAKDNVNIGDELTFSSSTGEDEETLSYNWTIENIDTGKIIAKSTNGVFYHTFNQKGRFNIRLFIVNKYGERDDDNVIVTVSSRPPEVNIDTSFPFPNKPNTVFIDGTDSYDPDYVDNGKLKYVYYINGKEARLENPNHNNSNGYFTFDSIGEHSIVLEVTDPDNITGNADEKVEISSVHDVDFSIFPRVTKIGRNVTFRANSSKGKFFEWNFGEGRNKFGDSKTVTHSYKKAGIYNVTLKAVTSDGEENTHTKTVYIAPSDSPFSLIDIKAGASELKETPNSCFGKPAYIIDRATTVKYDGSDSVNVDGNASGLEYSWKIKDKFFSTSNVSLRLDELGCFPVKLTIKDKESGKTHSSSTFVKVENIKPDLLNLTVKIRDENVDPVVVDVTASGANDKDGIIQNYLWYYYTDGDKEPQDVKFSNSPNASFVLNKVTGTYYFAVVMEDNNGGKTSSEDKTRGQYFVRLTGDNTNTPIVSLKVSDNNLLIGEETNFTAKVKNILGNDISPASEYSWDFDGDGFYEKKTSTPTVAYSYSKSGSFYAKVKVKYKGITSTKTVKVDVSNELKPELDYISVGHRIIFLNRSTGELESSRLSLGDGKAILFEKDYAVYEYEDGKKSHNVKLTIQEGTKTKELTKEVRYDVKNNIRTKKEGVNLLSFPEFNRQTNEIILEDEQEVYIYLGESKGNFKYFAIDYDLDEDSDLNGTKDDDRNNIGSDSFTTGEPVKIDLNNQKIQKLRAYLIAEDRRTVVSSLDFDIVKNYIEEVDVSDINFDGIASEDLIEIEKLKTIIGGFPPKHRFPLINKLSMLQESWFDEREKTQIILDIGNYIGPLEDINSLDKQEFINIVEGFLVRGNQDKSIVNLSYNVIKNLIPKELPDYEKVMEELTTIKNSVDIEMNKIIGSSILESIKDYEGITNDDKFTIKSQLKVMIYNNNIPEEEVPIQGDPQSPETPTEPEKPQEEDSDETPIIITILKSIFYIFGGIIGIIIGGGLLLFIFFLVTNKDKNVEFQDFLIDLAKGGKNKDKDEEDDDIFGSLDIEEEPKDEKIQEPKEEPKESYSNSSEAEKSSYTQKANMFSSEMNDISTKEEPKEELKKELKEDTISTFESETKTEVETPAEETEVTADKPAEKADTQAENKDEEDVPDWLKGSFTPSVEEEKSEEKVVVKADGDAESETKSEVVTPAEETEVTSDEPVKKADTEAENKEEEDVPDWLKGSFTPSVEEENSEEKVVVKADGDAEPETKTEVETPAEETEVTADEPAEKADTQAENKEEEDVPDWLKGSFTPSVEEENSEEKVVVKADGDAESETKSEVVTPAEETEVTADKPAEKADTEAETKEEEDVPDWLKGSFTPSVEEEKSEEKIDEEKKPKKTKKTTKKETPEKDNEEKPKKKTTRKSRKDKPEE